MQKLLQICAFMFRVPKDIALKMIIKINLLAIYQYQLLQTSILDWSNKKIEERRKAQEIARNILGSRSKTDLLTLKYGLPSSFTTLST